MAPTPESVKQLLESSDLGERLRAVNQMRELDTAIAFELIQQACVDRSSRVRYAAISQLDTLGHEDPERSLAILRNALLTDPEPDVQAAAADAIGGLQMKEAFDDLQSVYESTAEWLVKFSIVATLGELGEPRSFDLLAVALESDISLISTAAIGALGELRDPRALPLLMPFAESEDWQVRHRLTQALSQFDDPQAKEVLAKLSQDSSSVVAESAKRHSNP